MLSRLLGGVVAAEGALFGVARRFATHLDVDDTTIAGQPRLRVLRDRLQHDQLVNAIELKLDREQRVLGKERFYMHPDSRF